MSGEESTGPERPAPTGTEAAGIQSDEQELDEQELGKQQSDEQELDEQEKPARKAAPKRKPAAEGVLPKKAAEDDPRRWGDEPDDDRDAWLKEQRPPHWG